MPCQRLQAPVRWHTYFKNRQLDAPMAGIDTMSLIVLTMVMLGVVVIITLLELEHLLAAPGTPQHPQCNHDDQSRRRELEVRLSGLRVQAFAQVHATDGD